MAVAAVQVAEVIMLLTTTTPMMMMTAFIFNRHFNLNFCNMGLSIKWRMNNIHNDIKMKYK
ncbi:hypothetical protein P5673_003778 [Acropora cervicornis]|uniref:Uncharacterized protein n=1 Tax=Acropora cervicornis TaxID=6130 RepID=A0AAD9R1D2_ACRCE|nr:hypothetical protein P5673_003778 [Acropora cervicornis]